MQTCPVCANAVAANAAEGRSALCSHCGARLRVGSGDRWIDVARVANLAEAGFLTDDLSGRGIEARIHHFEDFNAVDGRWAAGFLIQVAEDSAPAAAEHIRLHLADEDYRREMAVRRGDMAADSFDPTIWRPLALAMIAGVASFVLGQQFGEPGRAPRGALPAAIGEVGRPLVTEANPGQPRYRLTFDRRREMWYLDSDRNGDGVYDDRQRFRASGANW